MEETTAAERFRSFGLDPNLESVSLDKLRQVRREIKDEAYTWIYCNRGELRPPSVDVFVAIDSEIKRRMWIDLGELAVGAMTHVFLEKKYGKSIRDIRKLAARTCADELPKCATDPGGQH